MTLKPCNEWFSIKWDGRLNKAIYTAENASADLDSVFEHGCSKSAGAYNANFALGVVWDQGRSSNTANLLFGIGYLHLIVIIVTTIIYDYLFKLIYYLSFNSHFYFHSCWERTTVYDIVCCILVEFFVRQ